MIIIITIIIIIIIIIITTGLRPPEEETGQNHHEYRQSRAREENQIRFNEGHEELEVSSSISLTTL